MIKFLKGILAEYKKVEAPIYYLVLAEFFLQVCNTSFFILFNFFMTKLGYEDFEITSFFSYRFLAIMVLGAPLGFFIKGKKLIQFFYVAAVGMPFFSLLVILCAEMGREGWLRFFMMLLGLSFATIQASALPFIMLNVKKEQHSEAIALFFQTWGASIFLVGVLNYLLNVYDPVLFSERNVMIGCSLIGFISIYFVRKINIDEQIGKRIKLMPDDYKKIFKAVIPTLIIAIGAGFTIPVINLFFLHVHGIESRYFSILSAITYVLVPIFVTFIPYIRKNFGYKTAITLFQSLSIIALFLMATTELYTELGIAVYLAIFFYIIRQPLMNVAGPMTSELTMYYVGKRNQEFISAINSSIWSGSWLFSLTMFSWLRQLEIRYVWIFMITVVLYIIGVFWYYLLIREFENREENI